MLFELIERAGLSARSFARLVGTEPPRLSEIRKGKRLAPLKKIERWAEVLGITNRKERERFYDLAALTHTPERLQKLIIELEKKTGNSLRQLVLLCYINKITS